MHAPRLSSGLANKVCASLPQVQNGLSKYTMRHWAPSQRCLELREPALCWTGNLVDEQHLYFECPTLQGVRDSFDGLSGDCAATMVEFFNPEAT